jgi:DNA replication and repair protein RecF
MIKEVRLKDFRNHGSVSLALGEGINLFYGDNGAGKTSLLEAVYVALKGRSFRHGDSADMVREGADCAVVMLSMAAGDVEHTLSRQLSRKGGTRLKLDGREETSGERMVPAWAEAFSQGNIDIIKGEPSRRRDWVDDLVATCFAGAREVMGQYRKALYQRNEVLKAIRKGIAGKKESVPWEDILAEKGCEILAWRKEALGFLEEEAGSMLKRKEESLRIGYYGTFEDEGDLREKMERFRDKEVMRGATMIGVHRDEIAFFLEGRNLKRKGSQGQQRVIAALLTMAASEFVKEKTGNPCLIMFDDLPSELDQGTTSWLLEEINKKGQVLITANTNRLEDFNGWGARFFRVKPGAVEPR